MQEIFKDVPNYEGHYQVSNLGRVKSLKYGKERILKQFLTCSKRNQYLAVDINKKTIKVHQLVAITFLGHTPCGLKIVVDHIDNDNYNNRLDNLQLVTTRENSSKDRKCGTSKYIGVSWCNTYDRWVSRIKVNGKLKFLGYFTNELEASKAYQKELKSITNK